MKKPSGTFHNLYLHFGKRFITHQRCVACMRWLISEEEDLYKSHIGEPCNNRLSHAYVQETAMPLSTCLFPMLVQAIVHFVWKTAVWNKCSKQSDRLSEGWRHTSIRSLKAFDHLIDTTVLFFFASHTELCCVCHACLNSLRFISVFLPLTLADGQGGCRHCSATLLTPPLAYADTLNAPV